VFFFKSEDPAPLRHARSLQNASDKASILEAEIESDAIGDYVLAHELRAHVHEARSVHPVIASYRAAIRSLDDVIRLRRQTQLNVLVAVSTAVAATGAVFVLYNAPLQSEHHLWLPILGAAVVLISLAILFLVGVIAGRYLSRRRPP
jgi:hypothetical protein